MGMNLRCRQAGPRPAPQSGPLLGGVRCPPACPGQSLHQPRAPAPAWGSPLLGLPAALPRGPRPCIEQQGLGVGRPSLPAVVRQKVPRCQGVPVPRSSPVLRPADSAHSWAHQTEPTRAPFTSIYRLQAPTHVGKGRVTEQHPGSPRAFKRGFCRFLMVQVAGFTWAFELSARADLSPPVHRRLFRP